RASAGPTDDTRAGRLPQDRPHQTQAQPDRVPRQKRLSHERYYPRQSSLPGIPETAWSDRDPHPQRSASSYPPANRARILSLESNSATRFYTGWVMSDRFQPAADRAYVRTSPIATEVVSRGT